MCFSAPTNPYEREIHVQYGVLPNMLIELPIIRVTQLCLGVYSNTLVFFDAAMYVPPSIASTLTASESRTLGCKPR